MERKSMTNSEIEEIARKATSDEEQELWEKKLLGNDPKHTKRSDFYKETSKSVNTVNISFSAATIDELKLLADSEGIQIAEYLIQVIEKHLKTSNKKTGTNK